MKILLFLLLLSSLSAHASTNPHWTGEIQYVFGGDAECTVPPGMPTAAASARVTSQFQYLACKTYADLDGKIEYRLDVESDGEYILILPRPGEKIIRLRDYLDYVNKVMDVCATIHDYVLSNSILMANSNCANQAP